MTEVATASCACTAEPFEIPVWVPPGVRTVALKMMSPPPDAPTIPPMGILKPLLTDSRMERNVWDELLKHSQSPRNPGVFLHEARVINPEWTRIAGGGVSDVMQRQQYALADLFNIAVLYAMLIPGGRVWTDSEMQKIRDDYLDLERRLLKLVSPTPSILEDLIGAKDDARKLREAAAVLAKLAAGLSQCESRPFVTKRDTTSDPQEKQIRWFAAAMVQHLRGVFGSPLYGVAGTITAAIFGLPSLEPRTVRGWCAER